MMDIVSVELATNRILYVYSAAVPVADLGILDPAVGTEFHFHAPIDRTENRKVLHAGILEERNGGAEFLN